jgi:hypothetical protein
MVSGENGVPDARLTASSSRAEDFRAKLPQYARLDLNDTSSACGCWRRLDNDTEGYIQVCTYVLAKDTYKMTFNGSVEKPSLNQIVCMIILICSSFP